MKVSATEPTFELRQTANKWWQFYIALQEEGFTEEQALEIMVGSNRK